MTANETARADWNGPSGVSWVADADERDEILSPVLDELFRVAALRDGERVIDIGCGCGATSLAAARVVGLNGHVLGLDLSEPMLAVARGRAIDAATGNVEFVAGDAQVDEIPGGHDVVISRFGTMFFDDAGAAFANIGRGLRTGGRLCIATWQPLADNDWITVPGAALARFGDLPVTEDGAPGMFGQSSTDTIVDVLATAGFADIDVRPVRVPYHLGANATEATGYVASLGLARGVLDPLEPAQRSAALAAITEVLAEHADADGVTLAGAILVTTASR